MRREGDRQTLTHACARRGAKLTKHPLYQHSKLAIDLPDISHMGLFIFSCFLHIFARRARRLSETENMRRLPFSPIEPWAIKDLSILHFQQRQFINLWITSPRLLFSGAALGTFRCTTHLVYRQDGGLGPSHHMGCILN